MQVYVLPQGEADCFVHGVVPSNVFALKKQAVSLPKIKIKRKGKCHTRSLLEQDSSPVSGLEETILGVDDTELGRAGAWSGLGKNRASQHRTPRPA